jgi:tetratricopeptide (TPR) repeat protein
MRSTTRKCSNSGDKGKHAKGGRRLIAASLVGAATVAIAVSGALWYWTSAPAPPAVQSADLDPAVAAAIGKARLAVQQEPRSGAAWGRLGMVLLAHEFPTEARICLAQAERLDSHEPRWPYYQGLALYQEEPDTAIPKLQRALVLFGDDADAPRLLLAEVLYGQGRLAEAEDQFRRVLQHHPGNARAHLGLGRLTYRRGDVSAGIAQLNDAASDPRTRKAALAVLAEIHQRQGDESAANQELRRLATLPDDQPWPDPFAQELMHLQAGQKNYLDRANRLLDQERVAEAIPLLQQAVREYPNGDWAWLLLGKAFLKRSELPRAVEALRTAVRLAPNSVEAQFHLGLASFAQKDRRTAAACFLKVIELKPDAQAYYLLGHCLAQDGDRRNATNAFRKALRYRPNYSQAQLDLGTLLAQAGQTIPAVVHLRSAVELDPANARAKKLLEQVSRKIVIPFGP